MIEGGRVLAGVFLSEGEGWVALVGFGIWLGCLNLSVLGRGLQKP